MKKIVTLCGSTRFKNYFLEEGACLTKLGKIVLMPIVFSHADNTTLSDEEEADLIEMHKAEIDIADEVLVINPDGYIGDGTKHEIEYAVQIGKTVRYLEPANEELGIHFNPVLAEAIADYNDQIRELMEQKEALKKIDLTKAPTEEEWHVLCESSMRTNKIMGELAKKIFPEGEDVNVGCNSVSMKLFGFYIEIPTSRALGISIDTRWYAKPETILSEQDWVSRYCSPEVIRKYQYFRALDHKAEWKELAEIRCPGAPKWTLPVLWFGWMKWQPWKQKEWVCEYASTKERYDHYCQMINAKNANVAERAKQMTDRLVPEIHKWTDKITSTSIYAWAEHQPEYIITKSSSNE